MLLRINAPRHWLQYTAANLLLQVSDYLPDRGPSSYVNLMFQRYQKFSHIYYSDIPWQDALD